MSQPIINRYHGAYNKSYRSGGVSAIKYICIHYTGGTGSAKNNCIYFSGGNRNASADYFIDDLGIWEYNNPDDGYYTWAVGDGGGKYGITNSNSVSIEVVSNGEPFSAKEIKYLTQLTTWLMAKYNVPASRVVRHYDASRKQCPYPYIYQSAWNVLHAIITKVQKEEDDVSAKDVWQYPISNKNGADTAETTLRVNNQNLWDLKKEVAEIKATQAKILSILEQKK